MTQYELSYLFQLGIDNLFDATTLFLGVTSAMFVATHVARNSLNPMLVVGIIFIYTAVTIGTVMSMLAVSARLAVVAADVALVAASSGNMLQSTNAYSGDLWPYGSDYMTAVVWFVLWASAVYYTVYVWRKSRDVT